jgi:cell division cycle 2-like
MSSKRGRWDSESDDDGVSSSKKKVEKKKSKSSKFTATVAGNAIVSEGKQLVEARATIPIVDSNPFRVGQKIPVNRRCRSVDCYERLNFIDEGTYGMVFRARCKETREIYAIKQVKPGPHVGKLGFPLVALREINVLLALQHPNIIPVREMVVGAGSDKIFMVMEFCENDVKTVMKLNQQSFSTAEVKRLMFQMLSAIDFMHTKGYLHRDLKTSNLLYSNLGRLYVCDFGLARKFET